MPFDLGRWLPEFPIRESCLYLDHAAVCPLPFPVADAMRQRITGQEQTGYASFEEWRNATLACRHLGAQIIGCDAEDVTIVTSTSAGLSTVAEGLDWSPGDEVLVGDEEFAANVSPWLNLRGQGRPLPTTRRPGRPRDGRGGHHRQEPPPRGFLGRVSQRLDRAVGRARGGLPRSRRRDGGGRHPGARCAAD